MPSNVEVLIFCPSFGIAAIAARQSLQPIAEPVSPVTPAFIATPRTDARAFLVELVRHLIEPHG